MLPDPLATARLDDLFATQAQSTPDAVALLHGGRTISYAELDRRSNRLAHHLRSMGATAETVVAVCLPRTPDMVAALLGILKAGAAYLPLDPRGPPQRLAHMLTDSDARLLITAPSTPLPCDLSIPRLDLEADAAVIAEQPSDRPTPRGSASDLAYVMYTSGSTGTPKGVMVQHSVGSLIAWARDAFTPDERARMAATTSLAFDPSVFEIFMPLSLGGAVILKAHPFEPFRDDEAPTMLGAAPSVAARLLRMQAIPDSVQVVNLGGETVPGRLVDALYRGSRVRRIYNHYGPTEATITTTVALLPRGSGTTTIGRPIPGAIVEILDADGHPCPAGKVGEIHIAGAILARGYLNRPDLTERSFIHRPGRHRMYRTGDVGRWLPNGELAFLGRHDDQVKLSGIRVEPAEVEAALQRLPGIQEAAVLVRSAPDGTPRLVAYIGGSVDLLPPPGGEGRGAGTGRDAEQIRQSLQTWLPQHMIPTTFHILDHLPLTIAGKIDRAALAEGAQLPPTAKAAAPPRTPASRTARAVARAWRRTLPHNGRATPDPDLAWADAGGDSLRSLELLLRLERALGRRLAFDLISPDVTPRELTRRLHAPPAEPFTSGPTLFLVPGVLGDEPSLATFRRAVGAPLAFQVIEPPGLHMPGTMLRSLPETGRWLATQIARRQPEGSLLLGGYSFGAAAAYEAAAALQAAGRTIGLLLILDAPLAELGASVLPTRVSWLGRLLLAFGRDDRRRRKLMALLRPAGPLAGARVGRPLLRRFRGTALLGWHPAALSVPGLVALNHTASTAVRYRWRQLLPQATLLSLPGAHLDLFDPPSLALLTPAILGALDNGSAIDMAAQPRRTISVP